MDEATADLISEAVVEAVQGPKRVRSDAGEVEQHSIPDLIAADRYARAKLASSGPLGGMRRAKQIPPGAV